jgi:hypothetical protein
MSQTVKEWSTPVRTTITGDAPSEVRSYFNLYIHVFEGYENEHNRDALNENRLQSHYTIVQSKRAAVGCACWG